MKHKLSITAIWKNECEMKLGKHDLSDARGYDMLSFGQIQHNTFFHLVHEKLLYALILHSTVKPQLFTLLLLDKLYDQNSHSSSIDLANDRIPVLQGL